MTVPLFSDAPMMTAGDLLGVLGRHYLPDGRPPGARRMTPAPLSVSDLPVLWAAMERVR